MQQSPECTNSRQEIRSTRNKRSSFEEHHQRPKEEGTETLSDSLDSIQSSLGLPLQDSQMKSILAAVDLLALNNDFGDQGRDRRVHQVGEHRECDREIDPFRGGAEGEQDRLTGE